MKQKVSRRVAIFTTALTLACSGIAAAHHSGAAYDLEHAKTTPGTVKTVNWTNPHITFEIETDAKDGQPAQTMVFEVSSPGVLTRSGWTKRSLQPGDHAVFLYAPLRDGNPGGFLLKVTLPDGKELSFSLTPAESEQ
jgi:Cu/Ag efflux protein CusF